MIEYTWQEFDQDVARLSLAVTRSGWRPDYIVSLYPSAGALGAALAETLAITVWPLMCDLDTGECQTDCVMAEDAFGINDAAPKNILVVNTFNDTGRSFQWLKQNWQSVCYPDDVRWQEIWHQSVKFASLFSNDASEFPNVDFVVHQINGFDEPLTIRWPWQRWSPDEFDITSQKC